MVCTPTTCTFTFTDEGPGMVGNNVDTQTIDADLTLDSHNNITGTGTAKLLLTGGSMCHKDFDAVGDVVH
jgi:hypothetical protein